MDTLNRTGVALLIAPLVAPILTFVYLVGFKSVSGSFAVFVLAFSFSAPPSYIATVLLGLPGIALLRRLGQLRWWTVIALGGCIGVPVTLGVLFAMSRSFSPGSDGDFSVTSDWLIFGAALGATVGCVFWRISGAQQVDRGDAGTLPRQ